MIRTFSQNRSWLIGFRVISSFVQVVISQNEMKLLGSVEKWITLKLLFVLAMEHTFCVYFLISGAKFGFRETCMMLLLQLSVEHLIAHAV